jgi:hypothetical protein
VDWVRRLARRPAEPAVATPEEGVPWSVERATPGVAALFEGVAPDETRAVLDLGAATDSSLHVYGSFARRVRFADLLDEATAQSGWAAALHALPPQPERPYDLVLAWDVLDRLFPEDRPRLVERLADVTAPRSRLHVVVDASDKPTTDPLRFTLLDVDRLRYEPAGPRRPARPGMLPAEVERLLHPFQVVRAFTLRPSFREYVAERG